MLMTIVLRFIVTVTLLAVMLITPAQGGFASKSSAPMMEMADGSPCPPKDCAAIPDCPIAVLGGLSLITVPTQITSAKIPLELSTNVFAMTETAEFSMIDREGLRRPPKI